MSRKGMQLLLARAALVGVVIVCYLLLPDSLDSQWRGGLSILIGLVVEFALAWGLRLTAAELWWWPFRAPGVGGRR